MAILKNTWTVLDASERKRFAWLTALDILVSIVDILFLALLLAIVRGCIQPGEDHTGSLLPAWFTASRSLLGITLFFLLFFVKNILAIRLSQQQFRFSAAVAVRISQWNLSAYQRSPFNEYTTIDSSVQIRKIAFQPFEFCQYILTGIQQLINQFFLIFLSIVAILLFNAQLFLLLLLVLLPPLILVFYLVKKKLAIVRAGIRSSNERSFQYLLDALKGYVEANVYGCNQFFSKRFIEQRASFSRHLFNSMGIQAIPARVIEIFAVMGLFVLILLAQWSGNNRDTLLTIGAFMAAAYKVIPGMVKLINVSGQMKAYEHSLNELVKDTHTGNNVPQQNNTVIHSIEFNHCSFAYNDHLVLDQFSYTMNEGDFIGLAGRSGRGKTTLFNLVLGFLELSAGEIRINKISLDAKARQQHWPQIAYIRQQVFLINDSIVKNITLSEDEPDDQRLQYALQASGLAQLFPSGITMQISENGKNISGGQQQRIALARALYKDAGVFLLDEAFSELDELSEKELLCCFQQLAAKGKIVILITHDSRSLSYCTKIVSLDDR